MRNGIQWFTGANHQSCQRQSIRGRSEKVRYDEFSHCAMAAFLLPKAMAKVAMLQCTNALYASLGKCRCQSDETVVFSPSLPLLPSNRFESSAAAPAFCQGCARAGMASYRPARNSAGRDRRNRASMKKIGRAHV